MSNETLDHELNLLLFQAGIPNPLAHKITFTCLITLPLLAFEFYHTSSKQEVNESSFLDNAPPRCTRSKIQP